MSVLVQFLQSLLMDVRMRVAHAAVGMLVLMLGVPADRPADARAACWARPQDLAYRHARSLDAVDLFQNLHPLQRTHGNAAVSRAIAAGRIQRYVDEFDAETSPTPSPAQDLKETLLANSELFEDSDEDIETAVEETHLAEQDQDDI